MSSSNSMCRRAVCLYALLTVWMAGLPQAANAQTATAGQLLISEFRLRGPAGADDEFIEIYNNTNAPHTVSAASGTGYGVAASDGTTRCSIPNGTVIPARGHFLCVNSVGYSLASYPGGSGATTIGDAIYTTNIADNVGIAIFNNNTGGASYTLANRIDAVGPTSEPNTLYKEGTGYNALSAPFNIDYSFVRKLSGGCTGSASGNCTSVSLILGSGGPTSSIVQDTNNNLGDFIFVDTTGLSAGAGQRLGAPGPENTNSPTARDGFDLLATNLDPCRHRFEPPNHVRDFTSSPAQNSTFGTIDLRRRFTNTTATPITRLRFRIVDMTIFPSLSGVADLRARTSTDIVVTVDRPPCGSGTSNVTVRGTTLEQPPTQPFGGGFNGSLSVSLSSPLTAGASVDVRFLLGIQQNGAGRFCVVPETEPATTAQLLCAVGPTLDALTFTSAGPISIPGSGSSGPANPYPSNITVAGVTGGVTDLTVTLRNLTHTFPDDVDVLLVGPTGVKFILMSDALGGDDISGRIFTLGSGGSALPDATTAATGSYAATNHNTGDTFAAPAPTGPYLSPGPAGSDSLAVFHGLNPNGTWSLYIVDDVGGDPGTLGSWELSFALSPRVPDVRTTDFNGDRASDLAVFRPSTGEWYVRNQGTTAWGTSGDIPVSGDYNGDGVTDRAVYRPSTGTWFVQGQPAVAWGTAGDIPVPGDYLGAGSTQRMVYRPSTGVWYLENQGAVSWGTVGDIPVPGDYTGDGVTDRAVYRPSSGTWFVQGVVPVAWGAAGDIPVPADYDGNGTTDIAVYRPSTGSWILGGAAAVAWGAPGDVPVPADYDGDGDADFAVFRPSNGAWFVFGEAGITWGAPGDLPVPRPETVGDLIWDGTMDAGGFLADFDGNGSTDIAVYRPASGTWFVHGQGAVALGTNGDIPVAGDYNGSVAAERAVYRPSTGVWHIENQAAVLWGLPGDLPVPGDYNGNGKYDIAVYRPSTGQWFVEGQPVVQWGVPGDVPMPGDYDGNGTVDIAVYRPSTGWWYVRNGMTVQWGVGGDVPVPADYDGNGTIDVAVYRPSTGWWLVRNGASFGWGDPGDLPVPGDFDGNGTDDIAVFRPSTGWWFVRSGASIAWGTAGDHPASRAYVPR